VYSAFGKRCLDFVGASAGLIVLAPVLLATALIVRVQLGSPVLFRQQRAGRDGKLFTILKFRTMRDVTGKDGTPLPDSERLTALGRMLRHTSIDELPELVNVVEGHMSLIGPRPLLPQYLPRYSKQQSRRHDVRPGITGWAQINGRNAISWEQRFMLDVWYVDHVSLTLDVEILFKTIFQTLRGAGINHDGHATMPEFRGE